MIKKALLLLPASFNLVVTQSSGPDACLPRDACSVAALDSGGECVQELKDCNDDNLMTIDTCNYRTGCKHVRADPSLDFDLTFGDVDLFYEDKTSLSSHKEVAILNWIKTEVTQVRTPFCWKQSYGRGAGYVLSDCPAGKEKIGALCYTPCRDGYSRQGTLDCQQECKPGWRDDGLFCRLAEYGRGAGFAWQFGDGFSNAGMIRRCEAHHGRGNCEPWGAIWYPKCRSGYAPAGCCICRPSPTPNCRAEGYAGGIGLSCPVKIKLGDPTPLICAPHLERGGALCYPHCRTGFNGVGPVCWQQCDSDQVDCGAGCASSSEDCAFAVLDQVLAPIILAANIVTFGLADAVGDVADAVQVGSKFVKASTRAGRAMLRMVNLLQTLDNSVGNAIRVIRDGRRVVRGLEAIKTGYGAYQNFGHVFAEQFAEMTSPAIASTIDSKLTPIDALHVKKLWAVLQLEEMRTANNWAIADTTLAVVGLADATGIVDLVGAYAKPTCLDVIPFPMLSGQSNKALLAICKSNVVLSADASCRAAPDAEVDLDDGSYDPEGSLIEQLLLDPGPYGMGDSYVTMEVLDHEGKSSYCDTMITVADMTPPNIECTERTSVNTDPGQCTAIVPYTVPLGEDNCESSTEQISGLSSGSAFGIGVTTNSFVVTDSSGYQASCQFNVTVVDREPPTISCSHLAITKANDPGLCTAMYSYPYPEGGDNCEVALSQVEGPELGFDPCVFPVGSTTNSFQATDPYGNHNTCSFEVMIEDVEDPVITCPADVVRICGDISPSLAGSPITTDNCRIEQVSHSDDVDIDFAGGHTCTKITLRTWTAADTPRNTVECHQKLTEIPSKPDFVTDGSFCSFAMTAVPTSDPGVFFYNVFHLGNPGDALTFVLEIPYPFVSSSEGSVAAFDKPNLSTGPEGQTCFSPNEEALFYVDLMAEVGWNDGDIGVCGDSTQVTVSTMVPTTGFIHLSIPLELGVNPQDNNSTMEDETLLGSPCASSRFAVNGAERSSTTLRKMIDVVDPGIMGDPHVSSFTGNLFDYDGQCDLKLIHVSNFDKKANLTVHVRTTIRYQYRFISAAAIRIGSDTLVVSSWGSYSFNGVESAMINSRARTAPGKTNAVSKIGGTYPIFHTPGLGNKNHHFDIVLPHHQNITISTMKDIVSVKIHQPREDYFGTVEGFLGNYWGRMLARDGKTDIQNDINKMADEWQVKKDTDPILFETARDPQYPQKCHLPPSRESDASTTQSRRLLQGEGMVTTQEAIAACAHLQDKPPLFDACVYDCTITNDLDQALAY